MIDENESQPPKVAIIVLNWNNYEDTAACLKSLKSIDYPKYQVYVADNGSTDGSGEKLANQFERCNFIFNGENRGFAGGNNPAIERALSDGVDYILLLNNDTIVEPDFLTPLVETGEKYPNTVAVGGIILDQDGNIHSAGGEFHSTFVKLSHMKEPDKDIYETGFISGGMILLKSDFVKMIGGLNDDYFFGMEDQELAWKARKQGKRLMINPRSRVYHNLGSSAERESPFRYYHNVRNRLHFASKNLSTVRRLIFQIFFVFSRLVRFSQWVAEKRTKLIRISILAVYDHILQKDFRKPEDSSFK